MFFQRILKTVLNLKICSTLHLARSYWKFSDSRMIKMSSSNAFLRHHKRNSWLGLGNCEMEERSNITLITSWDLLISTAIQVIWLTCDTFLCYDLCHLFQFLSFVLPLVWLLQISSVCFVVLVVQRMIIELWTCCVAFSFISRFSFCFCAWLSWNSCEISLHYGLLFLYDLLLLQNIVLEGAFKPWLHEARVMRECKDIVCIK